MKHQTKLKKERGFSLVEMLVVIAVIGIIAAIAVPSIGSVSGKANEAKAKRNGQAIASLYNSSRGVGAEYPVKTTSGIINQLISGVTGADLAGSEFKISAMPVEEQNATMKYVSYDPDTDLMIYDPTGGQVVVEDPWWNYWSPESHAAEVAQLAAELGDHVTSTHPSHLDPNNAGWMYDTQEGAEEDAEALNDAFPDHTFTAFYHEHEPQYPNLPGQEDQQEDLSGWMVRFEEKR